ncbi:MAG: recombinase family protein [Oscillospiraceae bacterium]|nr:recombinase family protein [Oscillospiraceae bacterium]
MKAVIYARYSSDNQREESIEGQIRECTAFAEKNDITILRHYIDRAFSAKTDNRPEFQNMIKDSGKRLFDIVLVWKLDRFARNRYDSARYKATLKKNGVKVVSATEVISDGAEGIILESVLEGYAEYYSADLSEKVIRGMTDNALKCKYNGGTLPIGYTIDSEQFFQIDPLTAPFVLEAFQRYDEGATLKEIRDWLNDHGVRNTMGRPMNYNSVQHLLHNRRYIGEYTYRDIVVPDGIPAIVPQDLFDRVQEKLAKNKKAPARHKAEDDYLLTTKLFCGYCGAYLCGESGTSRTGVVHHYYKCVSVKKKRAKCHKKSVRKEWLEDLVVRETMKMVMDDGAIEAIVSMLMELQDRENVNLPLYEQQLRETERSIQNLLNAIQQGILTKSTKERLEELEAAKEELETRIDCERLAKPKISAEFMTFWLHRFRELDVRQKSHRKMLIDTFINAIFLYDDKVVITFNYKEGEETITFADLNAAMEKCKNGSDSDCSTAPELDTSFDTKEYRSRCPVSFLKKHVRPYGKRTCGVARRNCVFYRG